MTVWRWWWWWWILSNSILFVIYFLFIYSFWCFFFKYISVEFVVFSFLFLLSNAIELKLNRGETPQKRRRRRAWSHLSVISDPPSLLPTVRQRALWCTLSINECVCFQRWRGPHVMFDKEHGEQKSIKPRERWTHQNPCFFSTPLNPLWSHYSLCLVRFVVLVTFIWSNYFVFGFLQFFFNFLLFVVFH